VSGDRAGPGPAEGVLPPPGVTLPGGMSRTNSQESLGGGFGRSFSSDVLNFGDFPRCNSLSDLASLGLLNTSPFPSTDNLLNLVQSGGPQVSVQSCTPNDLVVHTNASCIYSGGARSPVGVLFAYLNG
jgi:hypothetical protein